MERRTYIRGVGAAAVGSVLAGCLGGEDSTDGDGSTDSDSTGDDETTDEPTYGTLATSVTDQPNDIDDFESLVVTIDGIWLKPNNDDSETDDRDDSETDNSDTGNGDDSEDAGENSSDNDDEPADDDGDEYTDENGGDENTDETDQDGETDNDTGRYYIEFEESQEANLVELQGSNTELIDETEVEVGDYQYLQLDVSETTGVLVESDEEPDVETPGNAPLQFNEEFEIRADERTHFVADFAPNRTGQGKYVIRPVAQGTAVLYGDEEYNG